MTTGILNVASPAPKWAFPRSYMARVAIQGATGDVDRVFDTFTNWYDRSIGYGITYILRSNFISWSSNRYTLDYVVYDCWWHAFFDNVHHPQTFNVSYSYIGSPHLPVIVVADPASSAFTTFYQLPQGPTTYWLPHYKYT